KEALLQSERNFRLLVENIHDGIFLSGDDDKIIYANRYALNMTGYSLEDLNALSVRDLIEKADITMIVDRYKERIKRKLDPNLYESIIRSKSGLSIPVEITMAETEWKGEMAHLIIFKDITERKKSERQLMESLEEKNTLLKEIHHRVKNNFQVITSLLSLQSRSLGDETLTEKFRDAQNRIRSMALIHERLYQSQEFSGINFGDYIKLLVQELHQANRQRDSAVTIEIHSDDIDLNIAQAIPCGLILNELLTNSFKYAFTSTMSENPTIEIDFREKSGMLCLSVADNGVGLPDNLEISGLPSLGLSLVSLLAENQLDGEMNIRRSPGAGFTILFPRR
ncbi:MAG: histidine kinase, partial [Methanobacteriales archaeon HGW-Methanobacteriales-2]